jgi:N6-adenosine-specific RNA methylase IME4
MNDYDVVLADPAWSFADPLKKMKRTTKRAAQAQYKVMSVTEIAALPVKDLANKDGCVLVLWVPGSMLIQGLSVMKAWGFSYKQCFVWVKLKKDHAKEPDPNKSTRVGMGRLFRQSHEIALVGTCGKSVYKQLKNKSQRSVLFDLNVGHSTKPIGLHERLEIMFPGAKKCELFARSTRDGWTCLGDAIDGENLEDSIQECINAVSLENKEEQTDA